MPTIFICCLIYLFFQYFALSPEMLILKLLKYLKFDYIKQIKSNKGECKVIYTISMN